VKPAPRHGAARLIGALVLAVALGGASPSAASADVHDAFRGNGMWIWQLSRTNGGSIASIAAQAKRSNIRTLFVKSGDSRNYWPQFSPQLVSALHARGVKVCAWQYVYGTYPAAEAAVAAQAVRNGADCLVIDAESEYEGRYVAATTYITELRRLIGRTYPVALTGFPYVHFHPGFPYSVFLAPGGAQYNQPQMYWHTIGTTVDLNFILTYTWNRIYKRPILPLGQTYDNAPTAGVLRFRQLAAAYGALGISWWSWQAASALHWRALAQPVPSLGVRPRYSYPNLGPGSRGDAVVWAQQHLYSAGQRQQLITGFYGEKTAAAVRAFQASRGLPQTGRLDPATWARLLAVRPVNVRWISRRVGPRVVVEAVPARASAAGGSRVVTAPEPASARLPALPREIPPKPR
jgi:hypothetical protein